MASLLYRIGSFSFRRWPVVVAVWLVAVIGAGLLASSVAKPFVNTFSIPGISSLEAQATQQELFPDTPNAEDLATANVVVAAPEGQTLADPEVSRQLDALVAELRQLPQLPDDARIVNPVQAAQAQEQMAVQAAVEAGQPRRVAEANARELLPLSQDGRIGVISWDYDVASPADVEQSTRDQLLDDLAQAREGGLEAEVNGTGMQAVPSVGGPAELVGVGVAAVVLVITFGSLVAAGLPILVGLVGVALGVIGIFVATSLTTIGSTTLILAVMIGLAVGIDYTLFILSRYRAELRRAELEGREPDRTDAVARSVGTAGSAVVFAGLTVIIALGFLAIAGVPFLTTMGLAASGTVLVAVLVALTLLPAVLGLLGRRAFGGRVRSRQDKVDDAGLVVNNGTRWARFVGRRPWAVVLVAVVALGALALPARAIELTLPVDATAASDTTQRKASDLVSEAFGPGREAPLVLVADGRDLPADPQARQAAYGGVVQWASGLDDVRNAQVVAINQDLSGATLLVTPRSGPSSQATLDLLERLRDNGTVEQQTGTTLGVTGQTAIQTDVSDRLGQALPIYLATVVGLAFLLLMVVFRSLLVPLTATFGFLLSVLATLGATVAIFQEGSLGLVEGQPLVSFAPIIVIGIVFGLAMDYQVFLVSRMREAHVHGMSAREAVVDGFRNSARVVTAAATIMISVFGAFILEHDPLIQSIGFALAAAVFLDAFVVRMALVPALMYLLGEKAWWLPRWLDRLLPQLDIEGEKLAAGSHAGPSHAAEGRPRGKHEALVP